MTELNTNRSGTLSVPGASLYYEVRGSGPALLMIHGGNGDADVYRGVAEHLADRYTVITYDRRGHSRSQLVHAAEDYRVETHSDDAYRLLTELAHEPACVFGSSSGAVIGLDLAVRHPERIKVLIAHEPPLTDLLSGDERTKAKQIQESLELISRREGVLPAIKHFASVLGMDNMRDSSYRPSAEQMERMAGNMKFFVMQEAPAIRRYTLELDALKAAMKAAAMRIFAGGGTTSRSSFPYLCAAALAEQVGAPIVEFPGNHLGYVTHSKEFAERLQDVLPKI